MKFPFKIQFFKSHLWQLNDLGACNMQPQAEIVMHKILLVYSRLVKKWTVIGMIHVLETGKQNNISSEDERLQINCFKG